MAFLRLGLVVGAVAGAFVVGGAIDQGFSIEVALVRGVAAFMAVSLAGYVGELIVVTAPARQRQAPPRRDFDPFAADEPEAPPVAARPLALPAPAGAMDEHAGGGEDGETNGEQDTRVDLGQAA